MKCSSNNNNTYRKSNCSTVMTKCIIMKQLLMIFLSSILAIRVNGFVNDQHHFIIKNSAIKKHNGIISVERNHLISLNDIGSILGVDNPIVLAELALLPIFIVLNQFKTTSDISKTNKSYQQLLSNSTALSSASIPNDLMLQMEELQSDFRGSLKAYQQLYETINNKIEILEGKESKREMFENDLTKSISLLQGTVTSGSSSSTDELLHRVEELQNDFSGSLKAYHELYDSLNKKINVLEEKESQRERFEADLTQSISSLQSASISDPPSESLSKLLRRVEDLQNDFRSSLVSFQTWFETLDNKVGTLEKKENNRKQFEAELRQSLGQLGTFATDVTSLRSAIEHLKKDVQSVSMCMEAVHLIAPDSHNEVFLSNPKSKPGHSIRKKSDKDLEEEAKAKSREVFLAEIAGSDSAQMREKLRAATVVELRYYCKLFGTNKATFGTYKPSKDQCIEFLIEEIDKMEL